MITDGEAELLNVIDGSLELNNEVDGEAEIFLIDGEAKLLNLIDGDLKLFSAVDGEAIEVFKVSQNDYYYGEYEFTPSSNTQVVECEDLTMTGNVIINPIPNNYGLITWNGSFIRVS